MDFTTRHLVMIQGQQQAAAVLPIQAAATTNGSLSSAPNIFSYRDKLWFVPIPKAAEPLTSTWALAERISSWWGHSHPTVSTVEN